MLVSKFTKVFVSIGKMIFAHTLRMVYALNQNPIYHYKTDSSTYKYIPTDLIVCENVLCCVVASQCLLSVCAWRAEMSKRYIVLAQITR